MAIKEPSFTIGIEEEYLLVDKESRDLAQEPPPALLAKCEQALRGQVSPEFLRSQIEVGTRVCKSMPEARDQIVHLRGTVGRIADEFGLAPIAASTHPFAEWWTQHHTDKERYNVLAKDLQHVARRLVICGMHVHVGIEDEELRIDLINQASYFLPHLLALSTSSPFWQGTQTGLKSYRLSVFDELPRTGVPHQFSSWSEYQRTVELLVQAGLIEDATKLWWDLRPSARFPTLEMRITDVCPLIDDGIAIASLYLCILRMLYRLARAEPALAPLPALFGARKSLARAALRHRARHGRFRQGRSGTVRHPARRVVRPHRRGRRLFRLRRRGGACPHHRQARHQRRSATCPL